MCGTVVSVCAAVSTHTGVRLCVCCTGVCFWGQVEAGLPWGRDVSLWCPDEQEQTGEGRQGTDRGLQGEGWRQEQDGGPPGED